jgi:DNA-binding response OmpR family regulator
MPKLTNTQDLMDELDRREDELSGLEVVDPAAAPAPAEGPARPWTALVVDDEEEVRHVICRIITRAGHQALAAADGEAALEILAERPDIDVMFLDAMMPRMDGLRTVARVRREGNADLPVVMVSGRTGGRHIMGGYKAGVDYYVTKPFRPDTILNIMRYLLGTSTDEREPDLERFL